MSDIQIQHISKSFGETTVLREIDLVVKSGSFVTLLGPSGCGKTTLLRIIAGLETPDTGVIKTGEMTFFDAEEGIIADPQSRKLGYVFQDYGLWPHLTVAKNIAFPLEMAKTPKDMILARVSEVLENVQLSAHADKLPEQLSGGQKQRVSIARALAGKPNLILFDEPLSNLDANLREELGQEIRLLSKQLGLTCINVTHDRREAQILSDEIALMKDGVFHQLGKPEALFRLPKDAWAARFLDAGNIVQAKSVFNGEAVSGTEVMVPRSAFHVSNNADNIVTKVLNCMFIEDRYEVTADLNGEIIKFFAEQSFDMGAQIGLSLEETSVLKF